MKKIATLISIFGILGISQAQLSVGSAGMNIKSGTIVSTQGLVLTPSSDLTFSNNELNVSSSSVAIGANNSINRLYTLAAPISYSGMIGIKYLSGELNGNTEAAMQVATSALVSGTPWVVSSGSNTGAASSYGVSNTFSSATIGRVTAISPFISAIVASQCGTTLATMGTGIYADELPGAIGYRFRITNGASVQTIDKSTPLFAMTQLASYDYNTVYTIDVAVDFGAGFGVYGPACNIATPEASTKVQASQCGTTVPMLSTNIYADEFAGATHYRFRVTDGGNVQTIDKTIRGFNFGELASYAYGTTYTIDVAIEINGTYEPYGPACQVTLPEFKTQIQASQCGITLSAIGTTVYADPMTNATVYRFRATNGASVQTVDNPTRAFYFTQLASYAYGTTYTLDVSAFVNDVWTPYGLACSVSTPAALTKVRASQCGITLAAIGTAVYADNVAGATQYRFRVTQGASVQTIDKNSIHSILQSLQVMPTEQLTRLMYQLNLVVYSVLTALHVASQHLL